MVAAKKVHSQIQKYILEYLPAIPLWYNGMWAQYNTVGVDELPEGHGQGPADHAVDVERLPQHDGHRRARQPEAEQRREPSDERLTMSDRCTPVTGCSGLGVAT